MTPVATAQSAGTTGPVAAYAGCVHLTPGFDGATSVAADKVVAGIEQAHRDALAITVHDLKSPLGAVKLLQGQRVWAAGRPLIGLTGAIAGGVILSLVGIAGPTGLIGSLVVAVVGAVILLWLIRVLTGRTRRTAL